MINNPSLANYNNDAVDMCLSKRILKHLHLKTILQKRLYLHNISVILFFLTIPRHTKSGKCLLGTFQINGYTYFREAVT